MRKVVLLLVLLTLVAGLGCGVISAPLGVVLAAPGNGSSVNPQLAVLTWVSISPDTYQVQVASDSSFQSLVVDASGVTNMLYAIPYGKLSDGRTYFWRVRAFRGAQSSGWTSPWYFVTSGSVPPTPPIGTPGTITVSATRDGSVWLGSVNYSISGAGYATGYSSPQNFPNMQMGTYTLTYNSGGPDGAVLESVYPSNTQTLSSSGTINFTLRFRSGTVSGSAVVTATHNGSAWSGPVNYTLSHYAVSGPVEKSGYSVPGTVGGLPSGTIQLNYNSGGPAGATLSSISPSAQQVLGQGGSIYYTMNFVTQQSYGSIIVNATLDGAPWQTAMGSGPISYTISGPKYHTGSSIPGDFSSQPTGTYSIGYNSGGPAGATFSGASPSSSQTLGPNGTIIFTLNFHGQSRGAVSVHATLNGEPWSGAVAYVLTGPYVESGSYAPQSFANAPAGAYSVSYSSGGPYSAVFEGVSPPSQYLSAGGHVTFTLKFVFRGVIPGPLVE
jgi:hypothetical protein